MADFSAADLERPEACAAHGVAVGVFSADGISGSSGPDVAAVVCVTCAVTEVEFVIDVAAGFVAVCASAVPLADWVLLVSSPVALETAPVAAFAALDAALRADPDPQPLSSAAATLSARAATTIGTRTVNLTIVRPLAAVEPPSGYAAFGVVPHSRYLS